MNHVIYIEADEEITSVISRIKKERAKHVALVVPKGALLLQSVVNLKMLKRNEKTLDKEITLVTKDRTGLHLASEVGFTALRSLDAQSEVKDSAESSKKPQEPNAKDIGFTEKLVDKDAKQKKDGPRIVFTKPLEESEKPKIDEASEFKGSKVEAPKDLPKEKKRKKMSKTMKMIMLGFAFVTSVILILGVLFVLPKATITVTPMAEQIHQDVELKVLLDGSSATKGTLVTLSRDSSKTVDTTGTKNIGEKAKGTVTVYNEWDSNPQPLVSGTRFSTGGKIFKTTQDVTVPGTKVSGGSIVAGTANVSVEASDPGEVYNIGPSTFTIPGLPEAKQAKIYGKSTAAMAGGLTKAVKVVSSQDLENIKRQAEEEILSSSKDELLKKASGKKVIDAAIKDEVSKEEYSNKEGEEASKVTLNLSKNIWVIAFPEDDAKTEISNKIKDTLESNKELVLNRFESLDYRVVDAAKETGMTLSVSASTYVTEKLELDKSKNEIAGKNKEGVINYYKSKESITDVSVDFWPFWVNKIPLNKSRTYILIKVK